LQELAADAEQVHPGAPQSVIWDFATFSPYATLPVPDTANDEAAHWYWEAGHFKKELGDVMLATMLAPPGSSVNDDSFGSLLQPDNIDAWLSQQRDLASRHTATVEASDDSRYLCCRSDNRTATAHP
jgi:hypothetical protein